jgi:hypothetical protein
MIMKKIIILTALILLHATGYAQKIDTRDLGSFSEISVGEAIHVNLIKGNNEKAEVIARGIDTEDVITDVSGDRLKIYLEGNNYRNIDVQVNLTYRELEEIGISSAARVYAEEAITATSLEIDVSSAGAGELKLNAGKVEIDISSAGNLELSGKTDYLEVDISSAGDLDAYDLVCEEAEVNVSSGGSANLNITDKISAKANSGGNIRYKGDPQKVYVNSNSGGSIKKRD